MFYLLLPYRYRGFISQKRNLFTPEQNKHKGKHCSAPQNTQLYQVDHVRPQHIFIRTANLVYIREGVCYVQNGVTALSYAVVGTEATLWEEQSVNWVIEWSTGNLESNTLRPNTL